MMETINWTSINSIATTLASVATAIGVVFGAVQIRLSKKQSLAQFEDQMDQQYRSISMELPVDILIGKVVSKQDDHVEYLRIRELIYNYLDLCNEQVYLRSLGRISRRTWYSWGSGIKAHLARPMFANIFEEVKGASGFTYLEKICLSDFSEDPKYWKHK